MHDLIEAAPSMLPLAGSPRLAVLGREVRCGDRENADLLAVEVSTARPVVIEVTLASNTDRRQALTQVLGYAAYLRRLDRGGLSEILRPHLAKRGFPSILASVADAAQDDPGFVPEEFERNLDDALADGRLRAVIVLDAAPAELVELVGYLQDVTNDRLSVDLVVVSAYQVDVQRVLVPQLIEPDRSPVSSERAAGGSQGSEAVPGADVFEESIASAPADKQQQLRRLLGWARDLEARNLAQLQTSIGKGRWVLKPRLPGQTVGLSQSGTRTARISHPTGQSCSVMRRRP